MSDSTKYRSSFLVFACRNFNKHQAVHVFGRLRLAAVLGDQENMGMGQPSLLELDDVRVSLHFAQTVLHGEVVQERL